jgi:formylglycine-generating enzyme required for sulfatase activity
MVIKAEITYQSKTVKYFPEDLKANLSLPLQMILIPRGSFKMGAPDGEEGSGEDEKPQHEVNVSSFLMSRYPITQEQWRAVAERTDLKAAANHKLDPNPSYFKEDYEKEGDRQKRPVESVSWQDALVFCARLSELTGRSYSLPSEAQWEYACRAGTETPFHFGESITTDLANYPGTDNEQYSWKGNYGRGPKGIYREQTTPVDYFKAPNAFGLSDMHGNVWEWCLDPWHDNYKGAPQDGKVWDEGKESLYEDISKNIDVLLKDNRTYVLRGGSWYNNPWYCRSASRNFNNRDARNLNVGFRVMCRSGRT